jgi:aspartate racemase
MGPEATADLFTKIIKATPVSRDQDHLRILVDCLPQVPDRTSAIQGGCESPAPALQAAARRLESWGAELLVIPCNTAHYYHQAVSEAVGIPVLHIMDETATLIRREHPGAARVGVLASSGTLETGLYRTALERLGMTEVVPGAETQEQVMEAIYGVKAGKHELPHSILVQAAAALVDLGAEAVVAGCTEVPIALGPGDVSVPFVDATQALARAAVRCALGKEP